MGGSSWSTQQLAEFVAALSSADSETSAASRAVEQAAEALDADIAAIVRDGELVAATGYADGAAPLAALTAIEPGQRKASSLRVPGVGTCAAFAAALEDPPGSRLVIARQTPPELTPEERGVVRAMASVAAMRMRTLHLLAEERAAHEELKRLADEQAALRRVATSVARGDPPGSVFAAVAEEVGRLVPDADVSLVGRYTPDRALEFLAGWSSAGDAGFVGTRVELGGRNVSTLVFESGRPARTDYPADDTAPATLMARNWSRSSAGAPIRAEGELWGVVIVGSLDPHGLPPRTEQRLAEFTEILATAIGSAQAREALRRIADEQSVLRRVATLVAGAAASREVFDAVAEEVGQLFQADRAYVSRFDETDAVTMLSGWSKSGELPIELPQRVRGPVAEQVWATGEPARLETYDEASGALSDFAGSSLAVPITVEGRLWGLIGLAWLSAQPIANGTEERLADFTELVASAIANAEAGAELHRIADQQAALRRVATLVAEAAPPSAVFTAVAEEVGRLLGVDAASVGRYHADDTLEIVAAWSPSGVIPVGLRRLPVTGTVAATVRETRRPARVDRYGVDTREAAREVGIRSAVAVPITVEGRLWGLTGVASTGDEPPLPGTEERLAEFTELVATAIANANARAELTASRARIVASADEMRRKIERDIHDGTQQRLVSLGLQLRAAQASVPADLGQLAAELDAVAVGLDNVFDELRELARGVHPAILAEGGLGPAIAALARRSTVPVKLDVPSVERLPPATEIAAYYAASEALANAAKHAEASVARVSLELRDGRLRLAVSDDGLGGAEPTAGTGLIGLIDRADALGGTVSIDSPRGHGTSILIDLPVEAEPLPDGGAHHPLGAG